MKRLRVLVLMHPDLVPPESIEGRSEAEINEFKTELDVTRALQDLGHEVRPLGVFEEMRRIREAVAEVEPDVVFNLLDEFQGEALFDQHVVSYLELLGVPYTGNNPRGLVLARDKALSKKVAAYHRIRIPRFAVFKQGRRVRRPARLQFPLIVKSLIEEASRGISKASLVRHDDALAERVRFVHERLRTDAIVEQFVPGRELYVSVLGNDRLRALPPRELVVGDMPAGEDLIATEHVKHNVRYQDAHGVKIVAARRLPEGIEQQLVRTSKRIYRALSLEGYGRIDYRLSTEGQLYLLEANPNPELARYEEMAEAARAAGIEYEALIQRIVNLGLRR